MVWYSLECFYFSFLSFYSLFSWPGLIDLGNLKCSINWKHGILELMFKSISLLQSYVFCIIGKWFLIIGQLEFVYISKRLSIHRCLFFLGPWNITFLWWKDAFSASVSFHHFLIGFFNLRSWSIRFILYEWYRNVFRL